MKAKYSDFAEKNPTFQDRIEAFTSGLLTPDTKGITLWAMEPARLYTRRELYAQVKDFAGGDIPITRDGIWQYCDGSYGKREGTLYRIGAVERDDRGPFVSYSKTTAGKDLCDPITAMALMLSGRLTSKNRSMLRIFGGAHKSKHANTRRGYAVYKVIKLLAENPGRAYREFDCMELLDLSQNVLRNVLHSLGDSGIINYESPRRERNGRVPRGWAEYRLANRELLDMGVEELYSELRIIRDGFHKKSDLKKILQYIKDNPEDMCEGGKLSGKLRISSENVSRVLSLLATAGYLESDFTAEKRTKSTSNDNTPLLWEGLLEPIESVAERLDPGDYRGFRDALRYYNKRENIIMCDIQRMLEIYDKERNSRGMEGSEEIDRILLSLPHAVFKASQIVEIVDEQRSNKVGPHSIYSHLAQFVKSGHFERPRKGFYRRRKRRQRV